jgi:hypothetical protein
MRTVDKFVITIIMKAMTVDGMSCAQGMKVE